MYLGLVIIGITYVLYWSAILQEISVVKDKVVKCVVVVVAYQEYAYANLVSHDRSS